MLAGVFGVVSPSQSSANRCRPTGTRRSDPKCNARVLKDGDLGNLRPAPLVQTTGIPRPFQVLPLPLRYIPLLAIKDISTGAFPGRRYLWTRTALDASYIRFGTKPMWRPRLPWAWRELLGKR